MNITRAHVRFLLAAAIACVFATALSLGPIAASPGTPPPYPNRVGNWTILDARAEANLILPLGLPWSTTESVGEDCSSFVSHVWGYARRYVSGDIAAGRAPETTVLNDNAQLGLPHEVREDPSDPFYLTAFANSGHVGLIVSRSPGSNTVTTIESKSPSSGGPQRSTRTLSGLSTFKLVRRNFTPTPPPPPPAVQKPDLTGDGVSDFGIVVRQADGTAGFRVAMSGLSGNPKQPFALYDWNYPYLEGRYRYDNTKVSAGDFNGDGVSDFGIVVRQADGTAGFRVAMSGLSGNPKQPFAMFDWNYPYLEGRYRFDDIKVTAGDFTGDGVSDFGIVVRQADGTAGFRVAMSGLSGNPKQPFAMFDWNYPYLEGRYRFDDIKVTAGDFTGDGVSDFGIVVRQADGTAGFRVAMSGLSGNPKQPFAMFDWNYPYLEGRYRFDDIKVTAGDFTGDGVSDFGIVVRQADGTAGFRVAMSGLSGDPKQPFALYDWNYPYLEGRYRYDNMTI